jgi:hypothetical protein
MAAKTVGPDDSVEELVERYPSLVGFLMDREIVCIKCGEPFWGSLKELVQNKGKDVDRIVAEINEHLTKS